MSTIAQDLRILAKKDPRIGGRSRGNRVNPGEGGIAPDFRGTIRTRMSDGTLSPKDATRMIPFRDGSASDLA